MSPKLDPIQRHALMARFRSRDTKPELVLRRALQSRGLRGYRVHPKGLPGRPDLAYTRWKLAVFVDGSFWHGHPSAFKFGTKGAYWDSKIRRNQERDKLVTGQLIEAGWSVLRLWDTEILRDPAGAADRVARALATRRAVA